MTEDQINAVLNRVKTWPRERQEDAVQVLLTLERVSTDLYVPDADDRAAIEAALAEIVRGEEPASEAEVQAVFRKYR
ncbi:MAG: hypothetical protein JOZ84_14800 [Methylobacteriaceae bacterium]|nr:hypothetical protein [Methylobacteriaceae bacterium]MBV9395668.1 hypothetical protein [Methylobacteriaceae bacterium]